MFNTIIVLVSQSVYSWTSSVKVGLYELGLTKTTLPSETSSKKWNARMTTTSMQVELRNPAFVTNNALKSIASHFPPCTYSFAYGSAIFPQKDHPVHGSMIDLVFVTDDPVEWHRLNLENNASHYSGMKYLGPNLITELQEKVGCGVYYNTYAVVDDYVIKYGVMSAKSLERDLTDWEYLYVAGRLHKPVIPLISSSDSKISDLIKRNRLMALHAALLELPDITTKTELYRRITALSYTGDCRMLFGEDPNKVENIVSPIMYEFDQIYTPLLLELSPFVEIKAGERLVQKSGISTKLYHIQRLPVSIQESLFRRMHALKPSISIDYTLETITVLASNPSLASLLSQSISAVVLSSSIRQTLVGFVSTGLFGSIRYALDKVMKKTLALSKYYSTNILTSASIETTKRNDCELTTEFLFNWTDTEDENLNWNITHGKQIAFNNDVSGAVATVNT